MGYDTTHGFILHLSNAKFLLQGSFIAMFTYKYQVGRKGQTSNITKAFLNNPLTSPTSQALVLSHLAKLFLL